MKKIIHIHAKCNAFEISEQVEESKTVRRLITIKKLFNSTDKQRKNKQLNFFRGDGDNLKVRTTLVNPEFNFAG